MSLTFFLCLTAVSPNMTADVEHPQAAHFHEVPEQGRAAALQGIRRHGVDLQGVVGHQAMAAGDQFQGQFALAHRGFAADHARPAQYLEKHAVQDAPRGPGPGSMMWDSTCIR